TQVAGNRPFVLDGEIGNASSCVELVRRRESCSWANIETCPATAAAVWFRGGSRQIGRCESPAGSAGKSSVVKIEPRNSQEPNWRETRLVCLPCHPSPAWAASGFSMTAAVSTKTLTSPPALAVSQRARFLSLDLISS